MGSYNPNQPRIVGQEWVPIRNEDVAFSPAIKSVERGFEFTLTSAQTLQDGRFYLKEWPDGDANGQVFFMSIYPRGREADTGPIRRVVIPCNNGGISGTGVTIVPATVSVADALSDPSDEKYVHSFSGGNTTVQTRVAGYFAVNNYAQELNGKRIIGVNLLYNVSGFLDLITQSGNSWGFSIEQDSGYPNGSIYGSSIIGTVQGATWTSTFFGNGPVERLAFGEVDHAWNAPTSPENTSDRFPWTFAGLQRFEATAANRHAVWFKGSTSGPTAYEMRLHYMALEVFYCEEQRVAVAGRSFGFDSSHTTRNTPYGYGVNIVPMRTPVALATNPVLQPGDYSVVFALADQGAEYGVASQSYPKLNGLRELYSLPGMAGVQLDLPFPIDPDVVGKTFTETSTHILPQLSVHTSGGPIIDLHAYGRQAVAPVYGSIYAEAEIDDDVVPAPGAPYPWVRYYARRWGDTVTPLVLTNQAATGQSVFITPAEWDALDEIVDRWKEITLRFASPPTISTAAGSPDWRWTAAGELAGNRWEVLGAYAPALSGITGNLYNLVPSPNQLSGATYFGTNAQLTWQTITPPVSGVAADPTADGVLIFAQDMPTVTGFGISTLSQPVSGIGTNCGVNPCCIPSAISYNRLTWSASPGIVYDLFNNRTAASGWGNADVGGAWTRTGGLAADYYVQNGSAFHSLSAVNTSHYSTISNGIRDSDITVDFTVPVVALGGDIQVSVVSRYVDVNNQYMVTVFFHTNGTYDIAIRINNGGVFTTLATSGTLGGYQANSRFHVRVRTVGSTIWAKVWPYGLDELDEWQVTTVNSTITTPGGVGVNSFLAGSNTNTLPVVITFDNFIVTPIGWGSYELQRMDTVDTTWQTIMLATNPGVVSFNDYEARVGILTSYRIRGVDTYGFYGLWSVTVSATITDPGVTIGCTGGHVLIFTSNASITGGYNLAYSSVWEGRVEEGFTFPEAGEVQLQKMYGRDFVTAFRPLERGGERFSRTVLVQAAAIATPNLGDFRSLRDMAWADLPYVCVRDEDGNRWFATVLVPGGNVRRSRQLYMAPVDIIEVTDEPAQVDP